MGWTSQALDDYNYSLITVKKYAQIICMCSVQWSPETLLCETKEFSNKCFLNGQITPRWSSVRALQDTVN